MTLSFPRVGTLITPDHAQSLQVLSGVYATTKNVVFGPWGSANISSNKPFSRINGHGWTSFCSHLKLDVNF